MLVVGLGNPGTQYEWTRHNLGFMLIDFLARETATDVKRKECQALIGRAQIEGTAAELVKPQTFMNKSGDAVSCLLHKRSPQSARDLIVISDDLALPFGQIRLRARGSSGGHNGLKSIIQAIKTEEFVRLRIGIKPEHPVGDTAAFVLDNFPQSARAGVGETLERGAAALRSILRDGIDKAMAQHN
jgi:PTH1 family peptidyl-tRNA hydrolase